MSTLLLILPGTGTSLKGRLGQLFNPSLIVGLMLKFILTELVFLSPWNLIFFGRCERFCMELLFVIIKAYHCQFLIVS